MFKSKFFFSLACALLVVPPVCAAPPAKKAPAKPISPEQYYTKVKLAAAKAWGEGLEFKKQGKFLEAAEAMKKSLGIREYFVATDRERPALKQQLAETWHAAGRKEAALETAGEALAGWAQWKGPGSEQSVPTLALIGGIYRDKGDSQQALKYYTQASLLTNKYKGKASEEAVKLQAIVAELTAPPAVPAGSN